MGKEESGIQLAICDYLALRKHFFWRQNTTPIYNSELKRFRAMPKHSKNGLPDIIIIKDGKFIGLEVKTNKGSQQQSQKDFEEGCRKVGGEYYVVRSVEEVIKLKL